jgi:hypothetical protein
MSSESPPTLRVAHAGSLTRVVVTQLAPTFTQATGVAVESLPGPSVTLAEQLRAGVLAADVYMTADPATYALLMGSQHGDIVRWWLSFARTQLVLDDRCEGWALVTVISGEEIATWPERPTHQLLRTALALWAAPRPASDSTNWPPTGSHAGLVEGN